MVHLHKIIDKIKDCMICMEDSTQFSSFRAMLMGKEGVRPMCVEMCFMWISKWNCGSKG